MTQIIQKCNNPQTITQTIICAKTCTEKRVNPIAAFTATGNPYVLTDNSQYFEDIAADRQISWDFYIGDYLFYRLGFGFIYNIIPELSNGSTYGNLILGLNNQDIISYFESLPNTQIPIGTKFTIFINVIDAYGYNNENISNKYIFTV